MDCIRGSHHKNMHHLKNEKTTTTGAAAVLSVTLVIGAAVAALFLTSPLQAAHAITLDEGIARLNEGANREDEAGQSVAAQQIRDVAGNLSSSETAPILHSVLDLT
jgi:uncharacterized protein with beta-barrel porin domain